MSDGSCLPPSFTVFYRKAQTACGHRDTRYGGHLGQRDKRCELRYLLDAVHIEYVQRTIASFAGGKIVCAGAVTPWTFAFFADFSGPALFVLRANYEAWQRRATV